MARSFKKLPNQMQVKWHGKNYHNYYFDIFPESFFAKECSKKKTPHHIFYDNADKSVPVNCILTVSDTIAQLDYRNVKQTEKGIFKKGILKIIFSNADRVIVKRIDWEYDDGKVTQNCAQSNWHRQVYEDGMAKLLKVEGNRYVKEVKLLSRDRSIVQKRKEKDKYACQACGYHLLVGNQYIVDCHHVDPLSNSTDSKITAIKDLVTLCPNCHRIAHTENPPLTVKKIKILLKKLCAPKTKKMSHPAVP